MKKKIYFAGSIRGGRSDASLYQEIIAFINETDTVLTEQVGDLSHSVLEQARDKDEQIYLQDISWLRESDLVIAECTVPSLGVGYELEEALAQAVGELRAAYPDSSYNCMVQSKDTFIALRAESGKPTRQGVVDVYARHGRADEAADYSVLRYRELGGTAGSDGRALRGVLVSSSGYAQPESEGWRELGNNRMIVASNRTGDYRIRSI